MLRLEHHILAALVLFGLVAKPLAQVPSLPPWNSPFTPRAVILTYDPADGTHSIIGGGEKITTLENNSEHGWIVSVAAFIGVIVPTSHPCFDSWSPNRIFPLSTCGAELYDSLSKLLPAGLTSHEIADDLGVNCSMLGGGLDRYVETSPHLYVVPEPGAINMIIPVAMCLFLPTRHRGPQAFTWCGRQTNGRRHMGVEE